MTEIARYAIQREREPGNWVVDRFVSTAAEIRASAPNAPDVRILDLQERQFIPYPEMPRPGLARWYATEQSREGVRNRMNAQNAAQARRRAMRGPSR